MKTVKNCVWVFFNSNSVGSENLILEKAHTNDAVIEMGMPKSFLHNPDPLTLRCERNDEPSTLMC